MTINRSTMGNSNIALLVNQVTGDTSEISLKNGNNIFNIGGGIPQGIDTTPVRGSTQAEGVSYGIVENDNDLGCTYGDWTIIPLRDFEAQVKVWGAGGGAHSHGTEKTAGGGGFSRADITFFSKIPYTIWVGQGGFYSTGRYSTNHNRWQYRTNGTFGNGGGAAHAGGSGGGLSGIFFNTFGNDVGPGGGHGSHSPGSNDVGGVATWFRSPSQNNSLVIAGGGGGQGNTGAHANGGGGGGANGQVAHNAGGGSQTAGGYAGYNGALAGGPFQGGFGGNTSHAGGGGGGWFGGGGGGHTGGHHDGGGGGSGHVLDLHSTTGYRNLWIKQAYPHIVRNGYTEAAPSIGNSVYTNVPANYNDEDWGLAGLGAGSGQWATNSSSVIRYGYWTNWRSGTNGRVVIKVTG